MTEQKVSYEEIAYSNMMSIEAIVSLLTSKGLITQQEILDELKAIRVRDEKEKNQMKHLWFKYGHLSSMKVCFYPYYGGFRGQLKCYVIYMGYVEEGWGI